MKNSYLGIIYLERYLTKSSYNNIKSKFYFYDKLYTYNFKGFKDLQLNSLHGKESYFKKVNLLVEQGLIEEIDFSDFKFSPTKDLTNILELFKVIDDIHRNYWNGINSLPDSIS